MVDPIAREGEAVEPIASTIGKINGGLAQTILDLQSIALDLQRFAAGHADTGPAFDKAIALQSAAVALQKHALHLREMIDPVRSVLRPERFYQAGVVAAADERFAVAAGFFRRALELCAEYPEAHKGLGDVLRKQGAHEDAIEQYRRAADAHARLADSLEAQGKLAAAIHELWTAGVVFMEQGFNDEAADTFRKAIRLDPPNAKAQAYLGSAFYRKQDWDAAAAAFRTAINLDPTCADAYSDLALTLIRLNRHDESSSLLSTSAAINLDHGIDLGDAVQVPVYRIKHDREQIDLLRQRGLLDKKWETYADYLNTLWHDSRTRADSGAPMTVVGADVRKIAPSYNRIVYLPESPAIPGGALRPDLSVEAIQSGYTHSVPGIVWMDNFLTEEALISLRQFCNEATVWKGQYAGGYVGAILKRGFSSPLILQIAEEIRTRFPAIFASHHLEQVWGFKYDSTMRGTGVHADFAAVNVNFWITPDEACRDPDNSGLMIWDKGPPKGWSFGEYNDVASEKQIRRFLADASAHSIRIPYRSNRCIIFDSTLFHETDRFSFVDAYELRRVNITLLYGVGLRTR